MSGAANMKLAGLLVVCSLAIGCVVHRDLGAYDLDEKAFDAEAMAKIEKETGIDLPDGAKGLAFCHTPPVDPIVFAKIRIPFEAQNAISKQIAALASDEANFPKGFANDECAWWPEKPSGVVISAYARAGVLYVELHLLKEGDDLILYIKYFTI
jgi:hypothetical protein